MKYYILINQLVLSKTELDIIDGAILDYIYFYCNSQNEKIKKQRITDEDGEIWTWVDYQSLLKDMPMLKLKSGGVLTLRMNKIEKAGYIKTTRFQHMKKYFRLTAKSDGLFIQMNRAIQSSEQVPIQSDEPIKTKDIYKDKTIKNMQDKSCGTEINLLLEEFKDVNPSYERLFKNKTQRSALDRLIKKYTAVKVKRMINALPATNDEKYAPTITTPLQLEQKLGQLVAFVKRENSEGSKVIKL